MIKGKTEPRDDGISIIVEDVIALEEIAGDTNMENGQPVEFEINIPSQISPKKLVELNKLFKQNQGKNKIALTFTDNLGRTRRMVLPYGVNYTEELKDKIKKILSE